MKLRRLLSMTALAGLTAGLMCLGARPAAAEEDMGVTSHRDPFYGSVSYRQFTYPSGKNDFSFTPDSYVSLDVVNGKFFMVDHNRADFELQESPGAAQVFPGFINYPFALQYDALRVSFFTPDLKLLHEFHGVRSHHRYSVPKDGNDYERIICRLESAHTQYENRSYKLTVWDEVDPVVAEQNHPGSDGYHTQPDRH